MERFRHTDRVTELLDREAIRDCIYTYCRGVDRADEESLRASYWPDATDCHGSLADGPVDIFISKCLEIFKVGPRNIHQISNILIEFQSDTRAVVESYFSALQRAGDNQVYLAGRYCDLFEKRGEEWRVLERTVVYDWVEPQKAPEEDEATRFGGRTPIGCAYPDDQVYRLKKKSASLSSPGKRI